MSVNILIADDDERIRRVISDFLKREGFKILEACDGEEAKYIFDSMKNTISLVILDVMMPFCDGWSVLMHIRNNDKKIPVMMLTAKTQDGDQIYGFDVGADDYVTKPVSPVVLVARVKALLRRNTDDKNISHNSSVVIDKDAHNVTVDGNVVDFTPKEYDLLVYLSENYGIALSREQIVNAVWGFDYFGDIRTLDTHIKTIRAKLGDKNGCIKTVRGYGYKYEVSEDE